MLLHDVDLYKFHHLCAVYAIERTGNVFTLEQLLETFGVLFTSWEDTKVGDIVCWEFQPEDNVLLPTQVCGSYLLSPHIKVTRHFGVCEPDGLVSDLSFFTASRTAEYPYLRFRKREFLRLPTFYFRHSEQ